MAELQQELAELVHRFRRLTVPGSVDWDVPGIRHFLDRCEGATPCEVASAAFALAARPELTTPALLPRPGSHWPKVEGMSGPRISHNVACVTHKDQDMPCAACRAEQERDAITPESLALLRARTAAEVAAGLDRLRTRPVPGRDVAQVPRAAEQQESQ